MRSPNSRSTSIPIRKGTSISTIYVSNGRHELLGIEVLTRKKPRIWCVSAPNWKELSLFRAGLFMLKNVRYSLNCGSPTNVRDAPESMH